MLADYETAPIDEKLREMLTLLKKMTLAHVALGPDDVRRAIDAGVSKEAIQDALEVGFLFNVYDRLADAMAWDVPERTSGYYQLAAKRLLKRGYG